MKPFSFLSKLRDFHYLLFIILFLAFFLRFAGLGFSNFYGDETKTFYLNKTIPATKFLLDQRKGPVQFGAAWTMEKLTGGYDPFFTRLPFAWAGFLSILVFYLIVDRLFEYKSALIASILFGLNGFLIAFSRSVQYQSFLILFGLLAVYFAILYYQAGEESRKHYLVLSGLFLGLAYLSHYDAVFFDIVVAFIFIKKLVTNWKLLKEIMIYFLIPAVGLPALFYVPYVIYGYYFSNTFNYLSRRLIGLEYAKNVSWYTFWVYNPSLIWPLLSLFFMPFFIKRNNWERNLILFWFLVPFVTFQFIITNPGTHIIHYVIPLLIIVSLGITDLYELLPRKIYQQVFLALLLAGFSWIFITDLKAYVPAFNTGYPWKDARVDTRDFQLFLYGFPYKRGWTQIARYVEDRGGVHQIYTNDNDTIAQYYLRGISYTQPGPNFLPEFFIYIFNNQEKVDLPQPLLTQLDNKSLESVYHSEAEFYVNGEKTAILYKLNSN